MKTYTAVIACMTLARASLVSAGEEGMSAQTPSVMHLLRYVLGIRGGCDSDCDPSRAV